MIGPWRSYAALLALVVAAGCGAAPREHFFMMAYLPPLEQKEVFKHPYTLRLKPMDISLAYDKEKIVYRYSQFEFEYYHYQLWAVKPQKMISDLLRRYLTASGCFDRVVASFTEHKPDFELSGEILAIEELDSGDAWFAHLAMSLRLTRYRSNNVLWSYEFDEKKPVHNKAPVYVVKALSELFEAQAGKMVSELESFLHKVEPSRNPGALSPFMRSPDVDADGGPRDTKQEDAGGGGADRPSPEASP